MGQLRIELRYPAKRARRGDDFRALVRPSPFDLGDIRPWLMFLLAPHRREQARHSLRQHQTTLQLRLVGSAHGP